MKKFSVLIFILLLPSFTTAQELSIGFNYSGLINSKNYESASLYSLEADFEIIEKSLTAGFSAAVSDTRISKSFISNPTPDHPYETSFKLGLIGKYYPIFIQKNSFTMKPFISVELGVYNTMHIETYLNMPSGCEEDYRFESKNDFYTNLSLGSVFFPEQTLSFVVGLKYQITSPEIKYEKPSCDAEGGFTGEPRSKFKENVELYLFLWSVGIKINFY